MPQSPQVLDISNIINSERAKGEINEQSGNGQAEQEAAGDQESGRNETDYEGSSSESAADEQSLVGSDQAEGAA
ncbi:hypothetical protein [Neptuniibacter pectenicola]